MTSDGLADGHSDGTRFLSRQLFTFVKSGEVMNDHRNFDGFGNGYLLLLQCLTGDNWSGLMYDS
jgi:hypothetical protein